MRGRRGGDGMGWGAEGEGEGEGEWVELWGAGGWGDATTAPPTGTRKFLSIDAMTASTLPTLQARSMAWQVGRLCRPNAWLMRWGMEWEAQRRAMETTSSGVRGAKVEVTERTQRMEEGGREVRVEWRRGRLVVRWVGGVGVGMGVEVEGGMLGSEGGGQGRLGMMSGVRLAAWMALMHVFWSMRGRTTTRGVGWGGAMEERASRARVRERPVAVGISRAERISCRPATCRAERVREVVSACRREEPMAFGCCAVRSPERPTPCEREK